MPFGTSNSPIATPLSPVEQALLRQNEIPRRPKPGMPAEPEAPQLPAMPPPEGLLKKMGQLAPHVTGAMIDPVGKASGAAFDAIGKPTIDARVEGKSVNPFEFQPRTDIGGDTGMVADFVTGRPVPKAQREMEDFIRSAQSGIGAPSSYKDLDEGMSRLAGEGIRAYMQKLQNDSFAGQNKTELEKARMMAESAQKGNETQIKVAEIGAGSRSIDDDAKVLMAAEERAAGILGKPVAQAMNDPRWAAEVAKQKSSLAPSRFPTAAPPADGGAVPQQSPEQFIKSLVNPNAGKADAKQLGVEQALDRLLATKDDAWIKQNWPTFRGEYATDPDFDKKLSAQRESNYNPLVRFARGFSAVPGDFLNPSRVQIRNRRQKLLSDLADK